METTMKWNLKHKERIEQQNEQAANDRLVSLSSYLNGGKALDIACGLGGNSFLLAKKNFQVSAVDISDVAVNYIQKQAAIHNLKITPQKCDLTELNQLDWTDESFDFVIMTYYLDRSLFPLVKRVIKENGYFFMETFYQSPENPQNVSNKYKLLPQELLAEFDGWKVLFFKEDEKEGRQTIFCQKAGC